LSSDLLGGFGHPADTTHLLENVLDAVRKGEMTLRKDMIDLFLETKDVLMDQVAAYRNLGEPDAEAYERICGQLRVLAMEHRGEAPAPAPAAAMAPAAAPVPTEPATATPAPSAPAAAGVSDAPLCVRLTRLSAADVDALAAEMALMGEVVHQEKTADSLTVWLN